MVTKCGTEYPICIPEKIICHKYTSSIREVLVGFEGYWDWC